MYVRHSIHKFKMNTMDSVQQRGIQAIVTGASGGIGAALCRYLCESGVEVIGVSRRPSALSFPNYTHLELDLTQKASLAELASRAHKMKNARLRVLIHGAAILHSVPFNAISDEQEDAMLKLNLMVPVWLTRMLLPWLQAANEAHTVFISSMAGYQGSHKYPGLTIYGLTKSGITGLAEALASEYAGTGLRFNALALGAVQTAMLAEAFPGYTGGVSPQRMAEFIGSFSLNGHKVLNGKVIPVSMDDPR